MHRFWMFPLFAGLFAACGHVDVETEDTGALDQGTQDAGRDQNATDLGVGDGGAPDQGTDGWRLPEPLRYRAVMPMTAVHPRPMDETEVHARHRWAHPDVAYRIPIVVQGGAWPFRYELLEGPEGMALGEVLGSEDYGILEWTPQGERSAEVRVRVTDQEASTVELSWSIAVDASRFLFVSNTGTPSGTGAIDDPLSDVADWYLGDRTDTTHAGKLVYFRAGRYTPVGQDGNENLPIDRESKPMSFMAVPGESVTFDATRANWTFWNGTNDVFFAGLRFEGSKRANPNGSAIANARNIAFYGTGNQQRITFFEMEAVGIEPGSVGNDNPAFVWRPSSGQRRGAYWSFTHSYGERGGPRTSNGPSLISISCVSYSVFESNTVRDWQSTGVFADKANNDYMSVRNNDLWNVGTSLGRGIGAGLSRSYDPEHNPGFMEFAYNRVRTGAGDATSNGVSSSPGSNPVWVYRNTLSGNIDFVFTNNFEGSFDRNLWHGEARRGAGPIIDAGDNVELDGSAFDADGRLSGEARRMYLGRYGAEIDP